jgi:hypothetical protein
MVTQTQFTGKDVYARTFDADEESLAASVERLEARGKRANEEFSRRATFIRSSRAAPANRSK